MTDLAVAGNPCLFVVGCLRSGTTMLRHVLNAHRGLAVVNETEWLPRLFEHRAQRAAFVGDSVTGAVLPELFGLERYGRLGLTADEAEACLPVDELVPYSEFVRRLFDAHGRHEGKGLVGEKSPGYVRHVPTLHHLWPDARFVHLVRDGRDVYLSLLNWRPDKVSRTVGRFSSWPAEPALTAALWWEWHVRLGLAAAAHLGPTRYRQLRYEDLVTDPAGECMRLCRFLGLPYDDGMLRFHERHAGSGPPPRRGPGLPITAGLRDWRSELATGDRRLFEAVAGGLLDELGYERSPAAPGGSESREASRVRAAFSAEAGRRLRRVLPWPGG